jgi:hypothetical protein
MQKLQRRSWKKLARKPRSSNFGCQGDLKNRRSQSRESFRKDGFGFGSFVVFDFLIDDCRSDDVVFVEVRRQFRQLEGLRLEVSQISGSNLIFHES